MLEKEMRKILNEMFKYDEDIVLNFIESHGTKNGIPDLHVRSLRADIWIELKQITTTEKIYGETILFVPWRPGQLNWFRDHVNKLGGYGLLLLSVNNNWYLLDKLFNGYSLDQLRLRNIIEETDASKEDNLRNLKADLKAVFNNPTIITGRVFASIDSE